MQDNIILKIVGVVCITILEGIAILSGLDGHLFGLAIALISGIVGYDIGKKKTIEIIEREISDKRCLRKLKNKL